MNKTYLGDGVYAERNEYDEVILTTENGVTQTNRIVLDPSVADTFMRWLTRQPRQPQGNRR